MTHPASLTMFGRVRFDTFGVSYYHYFIRTRPTGAFPPRATRDAPSAGAKLLGGDRSDGHSAGDHALRRRLWVFELERVLVLLQVIFLFSLRPDPQTKPWGYVSRFLGSKSKEFKHLAKRNTVKDCVNVSDWPLVEEEGGTQ